MGQFFFLDGGLDFLNGTLPQPIIKQRFHIELRQIKKYFQPRYIARCHSLGQYLCHVCNFLEQKKAFA